MKPDWKRTLRLTAWNWYMVRKPLAAVCGAASLAEAALLLWQAADIKNVFSTYDAVFTGSLCPLVFLAAYLAALVVSLRPLRQMNGRTHAAYTVLTFRLPRWQLALGQTLAAALALLLVMAWQVVWAAVCYWPAAAIRLYLTRSLAIPAIIGPGSFWNAMANNMLLRLLVPADWPGLGLWLLFVAAPAVLGPGVVLHRGWRRAAALGMAAVGAVLCCLLALLGTLRHTGSNDYIIEWTWYAPRAAAALAVLTAASALWTLRALNRAEMA